MSKVEAAAVERIIANTINETAGGDPDALAARIVAALAEAGFRIVSANGIEDTALGPKRAETRQLYRSPNGDTWFLARDPATGTAFVRHQANAPSGGNVTDIELGAFLGGSRNPEHEALLRLVGSSILNPKGAEADDDPPAVNTCREWSDEELNEWGSCSCAVSRWRRLPTVCGGITGTFKTRSSRSGGPAGWGGAAGFASSPGGFCAGLGNGAARPKSRFARSGDRRAGFCTRARPGRGMQSVREPNS